MQMSYILCNDYNVYTICYYEYITYASREVNNTDSVYE